MRPLWLAVLLASPSLPPVPADYQVCVPIHNGPIERPDHYNAHPFDTRKADLA